jgi:hypothetical protein
MKIKLRILALGLVALLVSWLASSPYASADLIIARPFALSAAIPSTATWSQTYGGGLADAFNSMSPTNDGGYIAVGNTSSFGDTQDLWVVKLDASGNITWQNTYGGDGIEYASAVHQTMDWGYIVAGANSSFGAGDYDVWLLKLDSAGNISWQRTYGGTTTAETNPRVIQTMDGGYLLGATSATFTSWGSDLWVFKLDSAGNITWQNMYGGTSEESIGGLLEQSPGHYLVSGTTSSFGSGNDDIWLLQLDNSGALIRKDTFGHSGNDRASPAIARTSDGGFVLGGSAQPVDASDADVWVLKFNSTGGVTWSRTYGGTGADSLNHIVPTGDEGYILIADSTSFGGNQNVWVVKLDKYGNITWQKTYGGASIDSGNSIFETSDGGYIITGSSESFGTGASDGWIIKTDALGNVDMCPLPTDTTVIAAYFWPSQTSSTASPRMTWIAPGGTGATPVNSSATLVSTPTACITYMPIVTRPAGRISGRLNQAGNPAGGISLELRRDNGSTVSVIAATTTDSSGYYEFTTASSLSSGQSYFVRYGNPEGNDSRMGAWVSKSINSYVSGSFVDLGTGDLANVPLVAPGSGAVVALPYLFQWTPRPATRSDSYMLVIADRADLDPIAITWWLGYVNGYYMSSLSSSFSAGVQYSWWVMAWEPSGSAGMSYYYHRITFTSTGLDKAAPRGLAAPSNNMHLERLGLPHLK